jgi:serine protein kinase
MDDMNLWEQIQEQQASLAWAGTFAEYYARVKAHPAIARPAHARIAAAIRQAGTRPGRLGETSYTLFAEDLYGLERSLAQVARYFASAARGLETRRRILLLVGPPGSGKSTCVNLLKRGLEAFSRREEGALYAIAGCPIQEEPLHLIPSEFRPQVEQDLGVAIEGDLCPHCRWQLRESYQGRIEAVRVRRVVLSERAGIGIGTFVATDPRSQRMAHLIGSFDPDQVGDDRLRPAGRAFHLHGELDVANRGLMEFVEIFKLEERFLAILLVASEEGKVKLPGFGTLDVDEAIVAHTNEAEYWAAVSDPRTEALQDRLVVVHFPYNLRVSDEVRIYTKLLRDVDLAGVHLSPLALPVAATLAVLSRLEPRWGVSLPQKMALYDGQYMRGYSRQDVQNLQAESPQEGMRGISPRFIVNQIAQAISQAQGCLDPLDLLQMLWKGIEQSPALAQVEHLRLEDLFKEARREYDRRAVRAVQMAMVADFAGQAEALWRDYLAAVVASLAAEPPSPGPTGGERGGDEQAMRRLEERVHLEGEGARAFRRQLWARHQARGQAAGYRCEPRLAQAIETILLPEPRQVARVVAPAERLDAEGRQQRLEVIGRLVAEHGFEQDCAEGLLADVAGVLGVAGRRRVWPMALRWLRG